MTTVYLGLGTNLGNRLANLEHARLAIAQFAQIGVCSEIYETEAWGYTDQAPFLNQVIKIDTSLNPSELLVKVKIIEKEIGREESFRWGPRLIDIDILLFGNRIVRYPELIIPHKELANRAFVLVPLAEIAPNLIHPVLGKSVQNLRDTLPSLEGVDKCVLP